MPQLSGLIQNMEASLELLTPASTRAVLARQGIETTFELGDGAVYRVGPEEMPGEIAWRADWLNWFSKVLTLLLAQKPPEKQLEHARLHFELLVSEMGLHPKEALLVVETALKRAKAMASSPDSLDPDLMKDGEKTQIFVKRYLDKRLVKMLNKHAARIDLAGASIKNVRLGKRHKANEAK